MYCYRCGRHHPGAVGLIPTPSAVDKLGTGKQSFDPHKGSQHTVDVAKAMAAAARWQAEKAAPSQPAPTPAPYQPMQPPQGYPPPSQQPPQPPTYHPPPASQQPPQPPAYQASPAAYDPGQQPAQPAEPTEPPEQAPAREAEAPPPWAMWGPQAAQPTPAPAPAADNTMQTIIVGAAAALIVGTVLLYVAKSK